MKKIVSLTVLSVLAVGGTLFAVPVGKWEIWHQRGRSGVYVTVDCDGVNDHYNNHPNDVVSAEALSACAAP